MELLIRQIQTKMELFIKNSEDYIKKGNQAAALRARKISLELEKQMKEFRKQSVK